MRSNLGPFLRRRVRLSPQLPAVVEVGRAGARGKPPRYEIPKAAEFGDEIPRDPTGEVPKRLLREGFTGPAPE